MKSKTKKFPSTSNLLGLIFITLKLCSIIQWNWIWVLAPFWSEFIFRIFILFVGHLNSFIDNKIVELDSNVKKHEDIPKSGRYNN